MSAGNPHSLAPREVQALTAGFAATIQATASSATQSPSTRQGCRAAARAIRPVHPSRWSIVDPPLSLATVPRRSPETDLFIAFLLRVCLD